MYVIYVDDEKPAIDNFRLTVANFSEITELHTFQSGEEALEFANGHVVDVAFLDMEMPGIHGLTLARALKAHDREIRVVFVTAFGQYALDAFGVHATGYLLKPYTAGDIHEVLSRCAYCHLPSHRMVVQTIPNLSVTVDGAPFAISGAKPRELFALLIDRGEHGVSMGEVIACLWPERSADHSTQSLYRMTCKRLADALEAAGLGDILCKRENRRYIMTDKIECDLYRILAGDKQAMRRFSGVYLSEYAWAEERTAQLYHMQNEKFIKNS